MNSMDALHSEYKDFEESEWLISDDENEIVSNVKEIATNNYNGTNVRVDQIGPYKIAFRTKDSKENRLSYKELCEIAKPLQDFLNLPIYIGGSHSPLSKKEPNASSDIDIYVITAKYSYDETKELERKISEYIKDKTIYNKCSIGQVEKEWLELPYFYESVPIDENRWWELSADEIEDEIEERRRKAVKKIKSKNKGDILKEIEAIYGIKVNEKDIINITATPRWRSINDCGFRRGNLIKDIEHLELEQIMEKCNEWLIYENDDTNLYDAVRESSSLKRKIEKSENMSVYINLSNKNGKYWIFNSILNAIAEGYASDSKKIIWLINSSDENGEKILREQIEQMSSNIAKYFNKEFEFDFMNLDNYFEENNYENQIEELKQQNKKYRKICDLDLEVKLYAFNRLNKINKLFIINPEQKVGKMLKHSGLNITIPFINKYLEEFKKCPDYAKKPPSGYCSTGAIKVMYGLNDTYRCSCEDDDCEFIEIINKLWKNFNSELNILKDREHISEDSQEISVVNKTELDDRDKAIIVFGAPSIDLKNLLLLKIGNLYSDRKTTIVVEDIMAPYLYDDEIYDVKKVRKLYRALEDSKTEVVFNSDDENFSELVEKWLKQLKVSDLKKLAPMTSNSAVHGFHVYDAIHLAIMGATYEKVKEKTSIVHSYNETALHIFRNYMKDTNGFLSCHKIPGDFKGKNIRLINEKDLCEKEPLIQEATKGLAVEFKKQNNQSIVKRFFNDENNIDKERE